MKLRIFSILIFMFTLFSGTAIAANDDQYLSGYATALLKGKYGLDTSVQVRGRELFIPQSVRNDSQYDAIIDELSQLKGIDTIKVVSDEELARIGTKWRRFREPLFRPLVADPKWPKFHVAYHNYSYEKEGAVFNKGMEGDIGGTFSLIRTGAGDYTYTEVGLQGRVNLFMDLYKDSTTSSTTTLINSDYMVGIPLTFAFPGFTIITRFFHESTHVGDEYLLRKEAEEDAGGAHFKRVNLSYEMLEVLAAVEPNSWFRIYAGGGFMPDHAPRDYEYWMWHAGMDMYIKSEYSQAPSIIVGLDVKGFQTTDFTPSYSFTVGIETFENTFLTFEAYTGYSQLGQFYENKVTYYGIGFHLY
ncbi:DUF1207 domain-containing protein [Deferribacterales bacterium RsTz2092]|nr:hypothetical protein AGMMS49941_05160 [Deferribacterales bacterium]